MPDNKKGLVYDLIVDHELRNVTVEMIDWFADNMEKSYPLWHPEDHKSFVWEVSPAINVPCCLKYPYKDVNKPRY
jgi:hypothetical protein